MAIRLGPMTRGLAIAVGQAREQERASCRTPFLLTETDQERFFSERCTRDNAFQGRYWALLDGNNAVGMGGLENIEWENGCAEISLIILPHYRREGYGRRAVAALLDEGFLNMGLHLIYGECYTCSPSLAFWQEMVHHFHGEAVFLRSRKRWNGSLYPMMYFSFEVDDVSTDQPTV